MRYSRSPGTDFLDSSDGVLKTRYFDQSHGSLDSTYIAAVAGWNEEDLRTVALSSRDLLLNAANSNNVTVWGNAASSRDPQ